MNIAKKIKEKVSTKSKSNDSGTKTKSIAKMSDTEVKSVSRDDLATSLDKVDTDTKSLSAKSSSKVRSLSSGTADSLPKSTAGDDGIKASKADDDGIKAKEADGVESGTSLVTAEIESEDSPKASSATMTAEVDESDEELASDMAVGDVVGSADATSSTSDARTELEEAISALDDTGVDVPEIPVAEYEELVYDAPTDEEIAENAELLLSEYKALSEQAIESESQASEEALNEQIEALNSSSESESNDISVAYDEALEDVSNDVLKRGLARSSIAVNSTTAVSTAKAEALADIISSTAEEVSALEAEIAELSVLKQTALDNFNISYAVSLAEKIAELTAERDEKQTEVIQYNNELSQQKVSDAIDKAETESELKSEAIENTSDQLELSDELYEINQEAKYNLIQEYLAGMTNSDAKEALLNDELIRDSLSDSYYYTLYVAYFS